MRTKVTIGVCVRNCEDKIKQIIDRIVFQDFPHENIEVIFVDDGSEDNTLFQISKYAPKIDIKCTVYHHEWKGLGFSRNVVSKNAKGDYIVWVDDGTSLFKDYIKRLVNLMDVAPEIGIARGVVGLYSGSNPVSTLENMNELVFSHKYAGKSTIKLPGTSGSIYRVDATKYVGGFDENIQGACEDVDVAYRILASGWLIYITRAKFFIDYNKHIIDVLNKGYWYGYGLHLFLHKHSELSDFSYKINPLAGLLEGTLISFVAYKITHKKIAFLLPIFFFIKRIGWSMGFVKAHFDSYGHIE